MLNEYLITTKNSFFLFTGKSNRGSTDKFHVYLLVLELNKLGYGLTASAVEALSKLDLAEFGVASRLLIDTLQKIIGTNVNYKPLFKGFPDGAKEILGTDDFKYLVNRLVHYWELTEGDYKLSCGCNINSSIFDLTKFNACPVCQMQVPELGNDEAKVKTFSNFLPVKKLNILTDVSDLKTIFINLLSAKSSISGEDANFIKYVISNKSKFDFGLGWIPEQITFKENVGLLVSNLIKHTTYPVHVYSHHMKTPTDVLRVIVGLNDGDISLAKPTRIKLSNPQRRIVMDIINNLSGTTENILNDFKNYRERWLIVGEALHVGQFKKKYPKTFGYFDMLRNYERSIISVDSKIKRFLPMTNDGSVGELRTLLNDYLVKNPGKFARYLNEVLCRYPDNHTMVLSSFNAVITNVPTKILLTMDAYFKNRTSKKDIRYFMPKGSEAKMYVIDSDNRDVLPQSTVDELRKLIRTTLLGRFSGLEPLINAHVDSELKQFLIPVSQRSSSKTSNPMIRGSRIPFDQNTKVLRLFIYWKQNDERIDIDLTAAAYDRNFNYKTHIGWTNLYGGGINSIHSGDIQSAPKGASEFIDIDLESCRKNGVRYVVSNIYNYSGQSINSFECFSGLMEKETVDKKTLYDPTEVKVKFDIISESTAALPFIIDLETNEMIWADLASSGRMIESTNTNVIRKLKAIVDMSETAPTLYDLFSLHVAARSVTRKNKDKLYFTKDMIYKIDDILANYLI